MNGALLQYGDVAARARVDDAADVVIVGSGVAGATAARVLVEAGLDVVLVEDGPHVPVAARRGDEWSAFKQAWRDASFQVAKGRAFTPVLQGRCVGGSSPVNGAIIHRMPKPIHDVWVAEHGVGEALPWDGLVRAWDRMDEELGVAPTPDAILGGNNERFRDACRAAGIDCNPTQRAVRGCEGTARCNQGCPNARKQSMDVTYIPRALAGGARLYATCRADRIVTRGGRAVGVEGTFREEGTGQRGPRLRVEARHAVLLAAGAIHTPLLLAAAGVGRRSGLVGRRFQAHPGTSILPLFDDPVQMWHGATQGYESAHWWADRMKFETVGLPLGIAAARLPGFGPALMRRLAGAEHLAHWGLQVRAKAHGRVRRGLGGRPSIRYDLGAEDVAVFKLATRRLVELAFGAGARSVLLGWHGLPTELKSPDELAALDALPDDPRLFHCIVAHLFGTATLGADERSSVVSPRGECWELPGLYVVDASCFPTNMGVNPQHTIAAVAWLLAEGLADRVAA